MGREATDSRILAFVPNWLGDAVMCTPALRALRRRYPEAQLTVAGRAGVCALLEDLPWIDRLATIPDKPSFTHMMRFAREMRPHGRDVIVVFPHSFRAALFAWLIGGKRRIAYARNGRSWLLTDAAAPHQEPGQSPRKRITPIYMAREYLELVALLGCEDDNVGLELGLADQTAQQLMPQLAGDGPLIGIAPGAAFGPSKQWMPEGFSETVNLIAARIPARFVLLTGPGEEALRDAVKESAKINFIEPKAPANGIAVLKAVISQTDLLICNDSGARHIAVAFRRPVICIMGPTSPRYSEGPYEIGQVLRLPLECSPCQKPVCPREHHRCMRDITPEQVAQAAIKCLSDASHKGCPKWTVAN